MGRYFSPELFQRLFEEEDLNPIMITRAFSILHNMGIIDNLREPRLINKYFEEHGRKLLGEGAAKVKELVNRRLLSWAGKRNINPCWRLLTIISKLNTSQTLDDLLLLKSISSDIINETTSGIESAMNSGQLEDLVKNRISVLKYIIKTSKTLHTGDEEKIEKTFFMSFTDKLNAESDVYPILKTQMLINQGAYYLRKKDKKMSSEKAKEAILLGQSKNLFCLPQCYRIFALVCLSKQQAVETIEYLNFALTHAEKSGNYLELAISAYYAAAAQFLYGDVFNAARLARKSVEQSLAASRPDWADRSRFLEGRLEFELGRYEKALEIFEALRSEPFGAKTVEKDSLLAAWSYRCRIYSTDTETENLQAQKPQSSCYDADLFEMEAAFLSGDYKKTIEIANSLDNPYSKENFLFTEQADWRSGFAQIEHLFFNNGEIQERMISVFRSLALCGLQKGGGDEALQSIQQILRDEKLCEMDPWDAFYFFAKYRALEHTGASLVDLSTAVSMAFKRLQRRAGRIEDIETRRQYLNIPKWNSELSHAAKEYKLI
jgi:tetratricopeptide (TPR) repeat protein